MVRLNGVEATIDRVVKSEDDFRKEVLNGGVKWELLGGGVAEPRMRVYYWDDGYIEVEVPLTEKLLNEFPYEEGSGDYKEWKEKTDRIWEIVEGYSGVDLEGAEFTVYFDDDKVYDSVGNEWSALVLIGNFRIKVEPTPRYYDWLRAVLSAGKELALSFLKITMSEEDYKELWELVEYFEDLVGLIQ